MNEPKNDSRAETHQGAPLPLNHSEERNEPPERAAAEQRRKVGRPSVVAPFRLQLGVLLRASPRLKTAEILQRMRQAGYIGGKSVLYQVVRSLRRNDLAPLASFESLPGVLSQHDFGSVAVQFTGGRERIHFFASRLKYSGFLDVRLMTDDGIESLIRSLLAAFQAFGGVPLVAEFDNPRTIALRHEGRRIEWDETFGRAAIDFRFAPELRVGSAKAWGTRRLADLVREDFFRRRRFRDRDDLRMQLDAWQRHANDGAQASGVAAERPRLRALAISPAGYALCFPVHVDRTGSVEFQGQRYVMPPEAHGAPALLWLYPGTVHIVAGPHELERERAPSLRRLGRLHHAGPPSKPAAVHPRPRIDRLESFDPGPIDETTATEIVHDRRFICKTVLE